MSSIIYSKQSQNQRVQGALDNEGAHRAIGAAQDAINARREVQAAQVPSWEQFRQKAAGIRNQVLSNLDVYLNQFIENARATGATVHLAAKAEDACEAALAALRESGATLCVKGKSMVSEEIGLNRYLEDHGICVIEADAAERMLQLSGDAPSHIVVPAIHNDRASVRKLFHEKLGYEGSDDPEEMLLFLREQMRPEFLRAQAGITGCNFGIAETGTCTLVTNEGNGRMASSLPDTQIVFMGIERILPDLRSLDVLLELLVRSAVGAKLTSGVTLNTGARRDGEADGPSRVHIILVDNGRSRVLASEEFRPMLRCIRCGACMNICPVYRHITGHGYGSIYPGPMGIVLSPLLAGYEEAAELSQLCSQCGACTSVCPVMIPLHDLILRHRAHLVEGAPAVDEELARKVAAAPDVLGRVSSALCREDGKALAEPAAFDTVKGPQRAMYEGISREETVFLFEREATALGTAVRRVASAEEAPAAVAALVRELSEPGEGKGAVGQEVVGPVLLPAENGDAKTASASEAIARELVSAGYDVVHWDPGDSAAARGAAARARAGVTFASAAIAESGTVVQGHDAQTGRSLSLVPPVHIAIVCAQDIAPRMTGVADSLEERVKAGEGLPSQVVLITGPSNTADIELVRVVGVHGPVRTGVVVVG